MPQRSAAGTVGAVGAEKCRAISLTDHVRGNCWLVGRSVGGHLHRIAGAIVHDDNGKRPRFNLPETAAWAAWPSFSANYIVTITDTLALELIVTNTSAHQDLIFENCLHTYFAIGDLRAVSIMGLKGVEYLDKVENYAAKTETAEAIKIVSEVDRTYLGTTGPVEIVDPKLRRRIRVEKSGSASTVVWNPWVAKAQQMPDFGDEEYLQMVCVESGNIARNRITLEPGKSSVLKVVLSSAPI